MADAGRGAVPRVTAWVLVFEAVALGVLLEPQPCPPTREISSCSCTQALYGGWPAGAADTAPQRYGPRAARWVRAREQATLAELLAAPDFVAPGLPVFFVVARGTVYRDRFLASEDFGFG